MSETLEHTARITRRLLALDLCVCALARTSSNPAALVEEIERMKTDVLAHTTVSPESRKEMEDTMDLVKRYAETALRGGESP